MLAGVAETMLWALHNRASEARRSDGVLVDPESVRIQAAIDYDFAHHFGDPAPLAARAVAIDGALRQWLEHHRTGSSCRLARVSKPRSGASITAGCDWLSVDLPDAMRLRERFLDAD